MTVRVPTFIQGASHPAEDVRLEEYAEISQQGCIFINDLAVAAQATPNMSVLVSPGTAIIKGTQATNQGYYKSMSDAATTLTIAASDPTNPRIDLVVLKVQDAFYSGATNAASLAVVTGTPAASPAAPAAPANSIILAQVRVNATVTSVTNANITDQRTFVIRAPHTFQADQTFQIPATVKGVNGQTGRLFQALDYQGNLLGGLSASGMPILPFVSVINGSGGNLTGTGGLGLVSWGALRQQRGNGTTTMWSSGNSSRFYAPYTGIYEFGANIWLTNASSTRFDAVARINAAGSGAGGTVGGESVSTGASINGAAPVNGIRFVPFLMNAGDYVELFLQSDASTSGNGINPGNYDNTSAYLRYVCA